MRRFIAALAATLLLVGCSSEPELKTAKGHTKEEFHNFLDTSFELFPDDGSLCVEYRDSLASVVVPWHDNYIGSESLDQPTFWWLVEYFDGMCGVERPDDYYPTDDILRSELTPTG